MIAVPLPAVLCLAALGPLQFTSTAKAGQQTGPTAEVVSLLRYDPGGQPIYSAPLPIKPRYSFNLSEAVADGYDAGARLFSTSGYFRSSDPVIHLGEPGSFNPFVAFGGDPVNAADWDGRDEHDPAKLQRATLSCNDKAVPGQCGGRVKGAEQAAERQKAEAALVLKECKECLELSIIQKRVHRAYGNQADESVVVPADSGARALGVITKERADIPSATLKIDSSKTGGHLVDKMCLEIESCVAKDDFADLGWIASKVGNNCSTYYQCYEFDTPVSEAGIDLPDQAFADPEKLKYQVKLIDKNPGGPSPTDGVNITVAIKSILLSLKDGGGKRLVVQEKNPIQSGGYVDLEWCPGCDQLELEKLGRR